MAEVPSARARALVTRMLRDDSIEGATALRAQLAKAAVHPSCNCGCGSVGFTVADGVTRSTAPSPYPVEGEIVDDAGDVVGGVLLFVKDGLLNDLEVYSFGEPLPLPSTSQVKWRVVPRSMPTPDPLGHRARWPLLLLDIDGVLQPLGTSVPPGYERIRSTNADVVVSRRHGPWLRDLAQHFDLVWASTWGANSNAAFGTPLGLPNLPYLELGALPRNGTRKLAAVQRFVGDRPAAWIDDELYDDALQWADRRRAPTLLVRTAGTVGFTEMQYQELKRFGQTQAPQTVPGDATKPRR